MQYYSYVSTRACYDPAKLIVLFAPEKDAADAESLARFAQSSGWQALAEYDSAILIAPLAPGGWKKQPAELPGMLYDAVRNSFDTRCAKSLTGRGGKLWCWETMVYWVGYDEGADFAGDCAVAAPSRFAAAALVRGAAAVYDAGEQPSSHWLAPHVSAGYARKNCEIPACVWLLDAPEQAAEAAVRYYAGPNGYDPSAALQIVTVGGIKAARYAAAPEDAAQLLITQGPLPEGMALAHAILTGLFDRVIRWKNGPDGTLAALPGRAGFYTDGRFSHLSVTVGGLEYSCAVHLPDGMNAEQAAGLPLVFSVHGRGEPAWLFATKNGWDTLADRTREFVLAVPDSPGNIWMLERDGEAFGAMIDAICGRWQLDRTRVYLTGFSNGGSITREVGSAHPEWFAAIAPFNGPVRAPGGIMQPQALCPALIPSGYQLPYWVTVGDSDPAAPVDLDEQLEVMLAVNGCTCRPAEDLFTRYAPDEIRTGENWYTAENGYRQGGRFCTYVYHSPDGSPRVGATVMRDMPHGAITEQSDAAWQFLRCFSRPQGSKEVVFTPHNAKEGSAC